MEFFCGQVGSGADYNRLVIELPDYASHLIVLLVTYDYDRPAFFFQLLCECMYLFHHRTCGVDNIISGPARIGYGLGLRAMRPYEKRLSFAR